MAATMRLLAVTKGLAPLNYGYGAICSDAMGELALRGHDVTVLAAAGGAADAPFEVRRELMEVPAAWRRPVAGLRAERRGHRAMGQAIERGIDGAIVWHMRGISKGILSLLHERGVPVLYMLGDLWAVYEQPGPPAWWSAWQRADGIGAYRYVRDGARRAVGAGPAPRIAAEGIVCFASSWLRERYAAVGFRPTASHVIPNGIALDDPPRADQAPGTGLRLAFAGRLDDSKGADIAIRALGLGPDDAVLTLAGGGSDDDEARLRDLAAAVGVASRVDLLGAQSRQAVRELLRASDALLMPGRIEEAFGLVYIEAMAAGAAVVGTALGGAAEICRDEHNALVVPVDDATKVARAVQRLTDPTLRARLVANGLETARGFPLAKMVDAMEALLSRPTQV
jgi:glycosyltransferase involved in cell wall biosynthesis